MAKNTKISDVLAEVIVKGMQEKKGKNVVKIDLSKINEAAAVPTLTIYSPSFKLGNFATPSALVKPKSPPLIFVPFNGRTAIGT